jgi:hypothetical protein
MKCALMYGAGSPTILMDMQVMIEFLSKVS